MTFKPQIIKSQSRRLTKYLNLLNVSTATKNSSLRKSVPTRKHKVNLKNKAYFVTKTHLKKEPVVRYQYQFPVNSLANTYEN